MSLPGSDDRTRSSAVAVIADRTAYGILANYQTDFGYKLTNDCTVRTMRFNE